LIRRILRITINYLIHIEMSKIYIVCIEDENEVRDAIVKDVEILEAKFPIEATASAEEALELIGSIYDEGNEVGLILCDHVLPGIQGVELLIELAQNPETADTKKVLITGQAGHQDTIRAINEADIDYYISKPWTKEQLLSVCQRELTEYVIDTEKNLVDYLSVLSSEI
jgi:CheY-like chemotaxis protein